jgi:hypothetical protein
MAKSVLMAVVPLTVRLPDKVKFSALTVPVRLGDAANTNAPVPVSSVTAAARLAELGVPRKVAIPVPSDVMPVPPRATGSVPEVSRSVLWLGRSPATSDRKVGTPAALDGAART